MSANLAASVADFLAYKRALGRKYLSEEATPHLLLAFAERHAVTDLANLTPRLLDDFVASRPRHRARSFNHLIGVLGSFLDWAVSQQRLGASPWHGTRRRDTDQRLPFLFEPAQARQLLEAAAALPDNPRGIGRGPTASSVAAISGSSPPGIPPGVSSRIHRYFHSPSPARERRRKTCRT